MNEWMVFHRALRKFKVITHQRFDESQYHHGEVNIIGLGVSSQINYGDLAISEAQKCFVEKYFPGINYVEILDFQALKSLKFLKQHIGSKDVIIIPGGGNVGNLYMYSENIRRKIIEAFPNNLVINFPQSYYFTNDTEGKDELRSSKRVYETNSQFVLTARESLSQEKMTESFDIPVLFTPDIVLSMNQVTPRADRTGVLAVVRNDKEKVPFSDEVNKTIQYLDSKYGVRYSDNNIPTPTVVLKNERNWILQKRWDMFRKSKLVVTDRLHGMIFSVITGTPCLVINNANGKVKFSYLNWLKDQPSIIFSEGMISDEMNLRADEIITKTFNGVNLDEQYAEIIERISHFIGRQ
ncbi:polysaccharide pyruvyl transferase family protein [Weissella cibaria]|jgi:exopolysaccharide biosynthesis predicted pyruvyltransferase EpsI|uniref:polysaccharide pyruvyl transferase family protein n=1 Tax=Weissella cibaria TaxID=137591 RepID=UPI0011316C7E|nr:polysaccharide pyruvyl transferase family protein [Weissella cibaria]QDG81978.1 hypothetical protein Wei3612_11440 [Weissella cibaria]